MKKGFTLIEIVISITFITLISLVIILSIVYLSDAHKMISLLNQDVTSIYEIEDAFYKLRNDYKASSWVFDEDGIFIDDVLCYKKQSDESFKYTFTFLNESKVICTDLDIDLTFCSTNLFKISCNLQNDNYTKYYYLGDENNANTS